MQYNTPAKNLFPKTKYPSLEVRKPRADFTKKLEKMCALLDQKSGETLQDVVCGQTYEDYVEIDSLWVFGSYARGATTCGDLDILVKAKGRCPFAQVLNRAFLGKQSGVRIHTGTPESNRTGLELDGAKLIWQKGMDWCAAIAAIQEDPNAARFPRKADELVLRPEQTGICPEHAERLIDDCESGHYQKRFLPLEKIPHIELSKEVENVLFTGLFSVGEGQKKLAPYLAGILLTEGIPLPLSRSEGRVWHSEDRKTIVYLGDGDCEWDKWLEARNPYFPADRVIVMPSLNVRGPNGALIIEKGPAHTLRAEKPPAPLVVLNDSDKEALERATRIMMGIEKEPTQATKTVRRMP